MTEQLNLFSYSNDIIKYKINKPIRLIELFAGIGSQAKALKNIGANFEHYRVVEWDKYAMNSYNAIHGTNFETSDITKIHASDLGIVDTLKYEYIMTYSFPCQDLSLAGKGKGMEKGSGTRSGLLWEVERILNECDELPQVLLMENVSQVHSKKNIDDFKKWTNALEKMGYSNFWQDLNAKDYGIPQNRNRTFMISILGDYTYEFSKPVELKLRLKDMLEDEVDEKYFLSEDQIDRIQTSAFCQENKRIQTKDYCDMVLARDYKDPKSVSVVRKFGIFDTEKSKHQAGSVYDKNGLSPTLDTMQGGWRQPCIEIKNATKKGYLEAIDGDGCYISNIDKKRGTVQKQMMPTIKTSLDVGVVVKSNIKNNFNNLRIRKLTPKECWRLMGFDDEDFDKAMKINSNTQLYKQAGNSIVVNVLEEIFKQMM